MALKTTEEKYQEFLERSEIPIEETTTYERFQKYLKEELGYTDAQIEALWEATGYSYEVLATAGIKKVIVVYPWGREVRYGITGAPGLWGFTRMREILAERE